MTFLNEIVQYDKECFVYLNALGNENWDSFWLLITNQLSWIPLYVLFLFLIFKTFGWKKGVVFILFTVLLVTFSDQFSNLIKNSVGRLRPNRDPSINEFIRILKNNKSFSFVSGHATTSTTVTVFMYLTLRKYYKHTILFFIWPIFFAYSRIYIGVHFPLDIIFGALVGSLIGFIFYKISLKLLLKVDQKIDNS